LAAVIIGKAVGAAGGEIVSGLGKNSQGNKTRKQEGK